MNKRVIGLSILVIVLFYILFIVVHQNVNVVQFKGHWSVYSVPYTPWKKTP